MIQPHNLRAKIGDRWQTVGNIRPKDDRPGFSIGLTADFVQAMVNHKTGWFNVEVLPDDGQRKQRQESQQTSYAGDDTQQDAPW